MKKILLIIYIIAPLLNIRGQQRTFEDAKNIVSEFLSISKNNLCLVNVLSEDYNKMYYAQLEKCPFYVIKDSVSNKFVIVSGDKRMSSILGYGNDGNWNMKEISPALLNLLELYHEQYEYVQNLAAEPESNNLKMEYPNVKPLLKTKWHQELPYNGLCPNSSLSGCVATAMSQVMKYFEYPNMGKGGFSYVTRTKKYKCQFDFSNLDLHWENIHDTYTSPFFDSQNQDIATLTYACGVSVGMDYQQTGSGAYMCDVPYAMITYFNYNPNTTVYYRPFFKSDKWYQILCRELQNGRPVIYGGNDKEQGGHAFVIDGCNANGKFHVNWGWGGEYDGYYALDALDPAKYSFSTYQEMVINISNEIVGEHEDVFYANSFKVKDLGINKNTTFTLSDVFNYSNSSSSVVPDGKFYGQIGIALFDYDFNLISILDTVFINGYNSLYGFDNISFETKLTKSMFPADGTYFIAPIVQHNSSARPTRIRTMGGDTDYISIVIDNNEINDEVIDNNENTILAWSEDFEAAIFPPTWSQETLLGVSVWNVKTVLFPSVNTPNAASGRGYAYLDYSTAFGDLDRRISMTRLISEDIKLSDSLIYTISFQYCKYSENPSNTDVLAIYYEQDNEWKLLNEVEISNQNEWNIRVQKLPQLNATRFAFEASLNHGSSIFLDDIKIVVDECVDNRIETTTMNNLDYFDTYTIFGTFVGRMKMSDIENMPSGIYILRNKYGVRKLTNR